jgi:triosephosphate isomerase
MIKYVIANWKSNLTSNGARELSSKIMPSENAHVVLCPPVTSLDVVKESKKPEIALGAQNCSEFDEGAYTGAITANMLVDAGCEYVILGHSERRKYFAETEEIITKKAMKAQASGLKTVICIGETLQEYEQGIADEIVKMQMGYYLNLNKEKTIIAYEPIWAIGTGKTPTVVEVKDRLKVIKNASNNNFPVLYGGSVNEQNAADFAQLTVLDGYLIGGASLVADKFNKIVSVF